MTIPRTILVMSVAAMGLGATGCSTFGERSEVSQACTPPSGDPYSTRCKQARENFKRARARNKERDRPGAGQTTLRQTPKSKQEASFAQEMALAKGAESRKLAAQSPAVGWLTGAWCFENKDIRSTWQEYHAYRLLADGRLRKANLYGSNIRGDLNRDAEFYVTEYDMFRVLNSAEIELWQISPASGDRLNKKTVIRLRKDSPRSFITVSLRSYSFPEGVPFDKSFSLAGSKPPEDIGRGARFVSCTGRVH